jgi:hypothetical protein
MFSLSRMRPGVRTSPMNDERRNAAGRPAATRQKARNLLHTSTPVRSRSRSASMSHGSAGRSGNRPKSVSMARRGSAATFIAWMSIGTPARGIPKTT